MWRNEKKDDETEFVYRNQRLTPKITEKKKEKDVNLYCMAVGCDNVALLRCACDRPYCTFRVNGRDSCFRIHLENEHKAFLCSFYEGTGCKRNSTEASLPCGRCFICSTHANGLPNLYGCKVCGCRCVSFDGCPSCKMAKKDACALCSSASRVTPCTFCVRNVCILCKQDHYVTLHQVKMKYCQNPSCGKYVYDIQGVLGLCGCKICVYCSSECVQKVCICHACASCSSISAPMIDGNKCSECNDIRKSTKECLLCAKRICVECATKHINTSHPPDKPLCTRCNTNPVTQHCKICEQRICVDCKQNHLVEKHIHLAQKCCRDGCKDRIFPVPGDILQCKCPECVYCDANCLQLANSPINCTFDCGCVKTCMKCPFEAKKKEIAKKEEDLCVICMDSSMTHIMVPCGHYVACGPCSEKITNNPCPICRKPISTTMRVYKA
jgi:hypothetical protein